MDRPASDEEVTSLHDLSAVDLLAGFRGKQFSPSEVLEDVLAHVAAWEREFGKPVITTNQAALWAMLRVMGVSDPCPGLGRLLAG